jgi:outer membrane protein TolC
MAGLELRRTEIQIQQDVYAAVARLQAAMVQLTTYRTEIIPHLLTAESEMEKLFPLAATDYFHLIDVRRKMLKARDSYLDALFEASLARVDLVLAVGDLACASAAPDQSSAPAQPQPSQNSK